MRFRLAYLCAIPVMAAAPLHFEASRYRPTKCGAENNPVLATQGDVQYKVTRVIDVPQPNPLALLHWLAGFASVLAPPIIVTLDAMAGMRGEDDGDRPEDLDFDQPETIAPPEPTPDLLGDASAEDIDDEFSDPLGDDFDDRLAAVPDSFSASPAPIAPPDTEEWMAAIIAAAQNRAAPSPPIAPAEFADPLDSYTDIEDPVAIA